MPVNPTVALRPLPPVAARIDQALADLDGQINWLLSLSPTHNEEMWEHFRQSGFREMPGLRYAERPLDLHGLRRQLLELPMEEVESPLLESLLSEKQRELDRQIELIRLRGEDGFMQVSIDLFGDVPPDLKALALNIMEQVEQGPELEHDAGIDEVLAAAEAELAYYRETVPGFESGIVVEDDLNSLLMVAKGQLHIARDIRIPSARVDPLIQHEIGTHVVTRHNGRQQPLRQLEHGLAHYDALQEGLGVLSEYLAGFLPAPRLRILAARVLATDMMACGETVPGIYACLHEHYGMRQDDAFDVAVRACRGGGLTKDAVYLRGLRDLLGYLAMDGDAEVLFIGKFALSQLGTLKRLAEEGWVGPPAVLPRYWDRPLTAQRLARCREAPIVQIPDREAA